MNDYLLAGSKELDDLWYQIASKHSQLLCKGHPGICSWANGCGIGDAKHRFNVIPIKLVDRLNLEKFEVVLLVTPAKGNLNADSAVAISTIKDLLSDLAKCGIAIFESQQTSESLTWRLLSGSSRNGDLLDNS